MVNHQDSSPALTHSSANALAQNERQALWVIRDVAHFVSRSFAFLPGLARHDLEMAFASACTLVAREDAEELARLLDEVPGLLSFRSPSKEGWQLLHIAAYANAARICALLVERGAQPDAPCGQQLDDGADYRPGWTPLLIAARNRCEDAAVELLEWGADPACADCANGDTPMHYAASLGMEQLARCLILSQAPLDVLASWQSYDDALGTYTGNTPLHAAALQNQADIAWLLIKGGAKRDACGPDRRTPLFYAAAHGHTEVLEVLLAAGADPNAREACTVSGITTDLTPLHYAVLNGHAAATAMLLCYGGDGRIAESNCQVTPLEIARRNNDAQALALLETALERDSTESVFSSMDDQPVVWQRKHYEEMKSFLMNLLNECPVNERGLLVLSDWLAEVLGPENRVDLARAYREREMQRG